MAEKSDLVLAFYQEQAAQARQHELLRAQLTAITAGSAGVLLGLIGSNGVDPHDWMPATCVMVLALVGRQLGSAHQRHSMAHQELAAATRLMLERILNERDGDDPPVDLEGLARVHLAARGTAEFRLLRRALRAGSALEAIHDAVLAMGLVTFVWSVGLFAQHMVTG